MLFPGMVARALFETCQNDPKHAQFPEWCSANLDDSKSADRAYPLLIVNSFPSGIKVTTRSSESDFLGLTLGTHDCFILGGDDVLYFIRLQFCINHFYIRHLRAPLWTTRLTSVSPTII